MLDVPAEARKKATRQIRWRNSSVQHEAGLLGQPSNGQWFQEKPLSYSLALTVPQTDTGGRDEYSQALERTWVKELGKIVP